MKRKFVQASVAMTLAAASIGCGAKEPTGTSMANGGSIGAAGMAAGGMPFGSGAAGDSAATSGGAPSAGTDSGGAHAGATASGGSSSAGATAGGMSSAGATTGGAATGGAAGVLKSAGCGMTDHPVSGTATIDVSGTQREYILELPDGYAADTAYKLVFGWHWRGGNASNVANGQLGGGPYYGLEKLAKGTTIFVAPNGLDSGWANTGGRDIAFLKAMLAFFNSKLCIDQARIFSTGFSYGGMMSDAIGCDMADVFRAIAPMSGALYSGCTRTNTQPVAVWMSHGNNDDVVPLADGKAALDVFLKKNGCGSQTSAVTPSPCVAYQGCSAGHPVHYCEFDGGHQPPSFAPAAIWDFFNQF